MEAEGMAKWDLLYEDDAYLPELIFLRGVAARNEAHSVYMAIGCVAIPWPIFFRSRQAQVA